MRGAVRDGLSDIGEVEGVAEAAVQFGAQTAVGGVAEEGVGLGDFTGVAAGEAEEVGIGEEVGDLEFGEAVLVGAEDAAGTTEAEVFFGEGKAVGGFFEDLQALLRLVGPGVGEEQAPGGLIAASDAASELMELGEAEPFGVFNDHYVGVGHIHADFDDNGGDEDIQLAIAEVVHGLL